MSSLKGLHLLFCIVFISKLDCKLARFHLQGSDSPNEGYLVVTSQTKTFSLCPYEWDLRNSRVLCKHLGFINVLESSGRVSNAIKDHSQYWRIIYHCQGLENSLSDCKQSYFHRYKLEKNCSRGLAVWVSCQSTKNQLLPEKLKQIKAPMRLWNENYSRDQIVDQGFVEAQVQGVWMKVCGTNWTESESTVICGQLGFPAVVGTSKELVATSTNGYFPYTFNCSGKEPSIDSCGVQKVAQCHSGRVHIRCKVVRDKFGELINPVNSKVGMVRLRAGHREYEGRVELFINGVWGTVCDKDWDIHDASVICRQLGFGTAKEALPAAQFGEGIGKIHWESVNCTGLERNIFGCQTKIKKRTCRHMNDAGVKCNYPKPSFTAVRLIGGKNPMEGRVEVFHDNRWYGICGINFDDKDGRVVCRQLGLGFAKEAAGGYKYGVTYDKLMYEVNCDGTEKSIMQCAHVTRPNGRCVYYDMAYVRCTKEHPDILLDLKALTSSITLSKIKMYALTCPRDEGCLASSAYQDLTSYHKKYTRSLLRFSARILNKGTDAFLPAMRRNKWIWHSCHEHFHSMERFSDFDIIDFYGRKVAEGHKASFCLEDTSCEKGYKKVFNCTNKGQQGISVNCADNYKYTIDCQWVDMTDIDDGNYTLLVHINPGKLVGESDFTNNYAACEIFYHHGNIRVGHCSADPCHVRSYGGTGHGLCCHFPFLHKGKHVYECASNENGHRWCSTTADFDKDQKWGYCNLQKALAVEQPYENFVRRGL